jgi:serine/threonine-protein kinase
MKPAEAAKLVQEVAWALAYAHSRGVIHRDVKPDNIMIDSGSGRALVTDFGIARVTARGTMSQHGELLGTVQYMSPEQASGDGTIDGRADLYSLGVTAFLALTGRLPFESGNPMALVTMHITEPAPPLISVNRALPARLTEAVDRCLAKDPSARYATGELLAEAIADAQVTRRDIAPSVREFLSVAKGSAGEMGILAALGTMVYWGAAGTWSGQPMSELNGILVALVVIAAFVVTRLLHAARGVLRAGMDQGDVAQAIASSAIARDANVEYELGRVERLGKWLSTPWGRSALLFVAGGMAWNAVRWILDDRLDLSRPDVVFTLLLVTGVSAFFLKMSIAPKRVIGALTRGTPEFADLWRKFWARPVGRLMFRIAGVGLKKAKVVPTSEPQPTEVLIGSATTLLFEQLPKEQRTRLGDVPEVIGRLERTAATLRARRDELQQALADTGSPAGSTKREQSIAELEVLREKVEERLATAVAAMENLRLDLLRLRAGVGQPEDLTLAIEKARSVGVAVDAEIEAHREVEAVT